MNDRERIFTTLRDGQPDPGQHMARPERPALFPAARADAPPLLERFTRRLEDAGGEAIPGWAALADRLRAMGASRGMIEPVYMPDARHALRDFDLCWTYDRAQADDVEFTVTPAAGAIAETGSLILTADSTQDRLAALTPWIHVAVLDPRTIVASTAEAVTLFGSERSVLWVTGPSKTADIEGILVRGVHGPGIQLCLLAGTDRSRGKEEKP